MSGRTEGKPISYIYLNAQYQFLKQMSFNERVSELSLNPDRADVIIPAIYFNALQEFFQTYSKELEGKIIVDVSNPIAPDENGGFKKIIAENESAGKILSDLIPKNAKLIKTPTVTKRH